MTIFIRENLFIFLSPMLIYELSRFSRISQVSYVCGKKFRFDSLDRAACDAPAAVLTVLKIIPHDCNRAKSIKPTANAIAKRGLSVAMYRHTDEWKDMRHADIVHVCWSRRRSGTRLLCYARFLLRLIIVSPFLNNEWDLCPRIIELLSRKWIEIIQIMAASRKFIISFIKI